MFNFIKKKVIENRIQDEILYEYVLDELESNLKVRGLWAKAIAYSEGDDSKATSLYMQYRVQSIKDEFASLQIVYEEMNKSKLFNFIKNNFNEEELKQKEMSEKRKAEKRQKEITQNHKTDKDEWWLTID